MGPHADVAEPESAVYRLPNGDTVEVFGEGGYEYFDTGPVVGFLVDDVPVARTEMERQGIEYVGPTTAAGGHTWAHVRAPDGNVYEVTSVHGGGER